MPQSGCSREFHLVVGHQDGASAPTQLPHSPHPYAGDIWHLLARGNNSAGFVEKLCENC